MKRKALFLTFCVSAYCISTSCMQTHTQNKLIERNSTVTKLVGGFKFTEGPAKDSSGNIYFSDIPNNDIHIWTVDNKLINFRKNSGGSNGLFFDRNNYLIACEGTNRQITSISPTGNVNILSTNYKGSRYNSPNDLWIDSKGGIYFTDPAFFRKKSELELECDGVYYLNPDTEEVIRVCDDLDRPNGIIGTKDDHKLYISEQRRKNTWIYDINTDGTLTNKTLFVKIGSDGMTLDEKGNVYLTNLDNSSVEIFSSDGKKLESIKLAEQPTNVCFGGTDNKTLFITAGTSLYSQRMRIRGQLD